ncbi:hypothetical protein M0R88_06175 [Halorussus gelatinilyticus]|uniref:Uncharacterized protein n=1 Tax=Halorussus gelatinilyticus TaxID=2937524 RepID=A0A8U0IND1_9EURY|nr:hypothetical protein [Halorussus gelatinilyticus]UPW01684.1 hypothetical protein M0R88_06175 [Halorussus gelatinilyticus]
MDFRTLLAAVLGVGLGLFFLAAPDAVVRMHAAGRRPPGRGGEYGADSGGGRWRRVVQAVGVALVAVGLYFGASAL